jgi:hypothetical protein
MCAGAEVQFTLCIRQSNMQWVCIRVSFETSFDSKQPKLEPKLVSALSETKHLFRLFRFYTETASFGVSIEPKQTEDQPKQTETNGNATLFHFISFSFIHTIHSHILTSMNIRRGSSTNESINE